MISDATPSPPRKKYVKYSSEYSRSLSQCLIGIPENYRKLTSVWAEGSHFPTKTTGKINGFCFWKKLYHMPAMLVYHDVCIPIHTTHANENVYFGGSFVFASSPLWVYKIYEVDACHCLFFASCSCFCCHILYVPYRSVLIFIHFNWPSVS